jgi:hypothetical protein
VGDVLLPCDLGQLDINGSTRSITSEVRLEGMVGKNLLIKSTYNICVFLSTVFCADRL